MREVAKETGLPEHICLGLLSTGWGCDVEKRVWSFRPLEVPQTPTDILNELLALGWQVFYDHNRNIYTIRAPQEPAPAVFVTPERDVMNRLLKLSFDELIHPKLPRKRRGPKHVARRRKPVGSRI